MDIDRSRIFDRSGSSGNQNRSGSTFSFGRIFIIVIILLVLYVAYKFYKSRVREKTLVRSHNARELRIISDSALPQNRSSDYTFSIWYFVDNWNYRVGQSKVIFGRLTEDYKPSPSVMFDKNTNNILVKVAVYPSKRSRRHTTFTCTVENVPLQKWTNLIVSVENRALDVYLDGKLVKTCIMPGIPQVSSSNILLTPNGGFSGFTNLFEYYSYPINPKKAYDIFKSGLKSNIPFLSLGNYGLKVSFTKDNNEVKSLEI